MLWRQGKVGGASLLLFSAACGFVARLLLVPSSLFFFFFLKENNFKIPKPGEGDCLSGQGRPILLIPLLLRTRLRTPQASDKQMVSEPLQSFHCNFAPTFRNNFAGDWRPNSQHQVPPEGLYLLKLIFGMKFLIDAVTERLFVHFCRSRDNFNERLGDERADWWRRFPYSVNEAIRMARTSLLDEFINLDHGWWFVGMWSRGVTGIFASFGHLIRRSEFLV